MHLWTYSSVLSMEVGDICIVILDNVSKAAYMTDIITT